MRQIGKPGNSYAPTRSDGTPRRTPPRVLWAGPLVAERERTEKKVVGGEEDAGRSWRSRGATKPPTPRLAAVEVAEQALVLRVWGWGARRC
jgi:hypothetical protein